MKTVRFKTQPFGLLPVFGLALSHMIVLGQPDQPGSQRGPEVGAATRPEVGQGTNDVSMRQVQWVDSRGREFRLYVFHARNSKQIIAARSSNQVCYVQGKLYAVTTGIQSFYMTGSEEFEGEGLTEREAADFAAAKIRGSPRPLKRIDLKPLLELETNRRLAQPLVLRTVEIAGRPERGDMVVRFVSYTGLKGEVALAQDLSPLSMTLTTAKE